MSASDTLAISDMLSSELNVLDPKKQFAKNQWIYLPDTNNRLYPGGQINFNTSKIGQQDLIIYRNSLLEIPLYLTSSSTAYTAATRLAIKTSLLSLIYGLIIQPVNGGQPIVSETTGGTPIMNNLRLILESNLDFVKNHGGALQYFGIDRIVSTAASGIETDVSAAKPTLTTIVDPNSNKSLLNKVTVMETKHSTGTVTTYAMIALLPLKLLHNFFDVMGEPIDNWPLLISFIVSSYGSNTYMPWTAPTYSTPATSKTKLTVSGMSNAAPEIITTATAHGLAAGDPIIFYPSNGTAVLGGPITAPLTFATQYWVHTVASATTFTIKKVIAGAEVDGTAGGAVAFAAGVYIEALPLLRNINRTAQRII